jgi:single-strand DNA-binding protein
MTAHVDLVGNTTRDVEMRYTPGGMSIASFGLAVNRRVQNKSNQEWEDKTSFFDVTCFGSLADNVGDTVGKGTRVLVTGRLEQESWDDKNSGDKRSKVVVIADEVGPSLRWATADVKRNERTEGGGGNARPTSKKAAYDKDEEPFIVTDPSDHRWVI